MAELDKNLVKKTGFYFIGNFASKIIMAIMIPFYAYFVSVKELGIFDYSQILMNTFSPIIFLAFWEAILRFLVAEENEEKRKVVITTSVYVVKIIILLLLAACLITVIISNNKVNMYTLLMICVYGAAQIWQYYARALKFNQLYIIASVTGTVLNLGILIITICFFKIGGAGLFWSYIIGQLSIVLLIESKIQVLRYSKMDKFDWGILKQMLVFSVPLVLNLSANWLISGFGRIIITHQLGAYDNGLYSFAMKFGTVVSMLGTVISMALIEEAIIKSKEMEIDEYFSNTVEIVFKLFLSICVFATPFIALFYYFISHTEYSQSYRLVPLFLIYSIFMTMSTNIGAIFQARNRTNLLFYTTICGSIVTIIFAFVGVNVFGILGVAIAQILGALTMLFLRWLFAIRLINLVIRWNKIIFLTSLYVLVVIVCSKGISIIGSIICTLACLFVLYINKELIIDVKKFKKGK